MIEIRISDPQDHTKEELITLAGVLLMFAGEAKIPSFDMPAKSDSVFNAVELAESEQIAKDNAAAHAERNPDPKAVFGAPSTVAAAPSSIAPAANPATLTATSAPVPPVPNAASAAPVAAPLTEHPAADVDATGLPWDGRIHSRTKAVNNDGSWKKRRGVDDATVAQVEVELRGVPQTARVMTNDPATVPASTVQLYTTPEMVAAALVPPVAPAPVVPVAPPAAPVTTTTTIAFPQLLPKVTAAVAAGQLTQQRVAEVLAAHGLDSLPKLIARADLVPVVHDQLFGVQ